MPGRRVFVVWLVLGPLRVLSDVRLDARRYVGEFGR